MNDPDYFYWELSRLGESPEDIKVKFTSTEGQTRWLSISPELFAQIREPMVQGSLMET